MNSTPRSPRPTDPEFIKIRKMNPITAFLAFALLAAAAGMGYFVNLYLGATFFVVAVLVGTSLKMANVWQKFVILRMGKLQSVKGAGLFAIIPVLDAVVAVIDGRHLLRIRDRAYSARHAKRNVEDGRHPGDPGSVHGSALRTCRDVVEDQFIRARVAVATREIHDFADHAVPAESHALHDLPIAHVQTGNYAFGKNGRSSSMGMSSSSNALPLMAAAAPQRASA